MDTPRKDLSYFRLRLQELLNTSFPEKANDQKFIEQHSSRATNAYKGAFSSGNGIEQCNEIAKMGKGFIIDDGSIFWPSEISNSCLL
jgi:hypothetical protein